MKLYYVGHDCLFAVEQMMMTPRKVPFRGDPVFLNSSAEVNSASGKVLPFGQNACDAPFGAGVILCALLGGAA